MRQAHRVALRAGGIHAAPGWVVGGLVAAAFLSTTLVAGSTDGAAAATGRPIDASLVMLSSEPVSAPLIGPVPPVGAASLDTSGGVRPAASPARERIAAMAATDAAAVPAVPSEPAVASATPHPKTTPHAATAASPTAARPPATAGPTVVSHPKIVSRPTAVPVRKPVAPATAAPKPKATVPKPTPAIVYPHRTTGRATWGEFGGAVVTRLPQGTRIRVCGRLGCWAGVSTGYGPTASGGNLVDLDAAVFRRICGPLGVGVGAIVLSWR